MTTSDLGSAASPHPGSAPTPATAYVWVWLPGATSPVVAGSITLTGQQFAHQPVVLFVYARSYRERPDAVPLFTPELPLRAGTFDPSRPGLGSQAGDGTSWAGYPPVVQRSPTALAGCLRDAAPDAWGRRVINARRAGDPERQLTEFAYLLESNSDRVGALDFQLSSEVYLPRGEPATLEQLVDVADLIERGEPIPDELAAAAAHGTSIGGARPKALLQDGAREFVAKFASTTDDRPVVKAEAVGMLLGRRIGLDVPPVKIVRVNGKDVLLVERFDRPGEGQRRMVVSALTVLGLREEESRYASYADLARAIRHPGWADTEQQLEELYTRMVLNVAVSNIDDHLRNHAAFWDGSNLRLTSGYDISPQRRSTPVATHAIALTAAGDRASQFHVARAAASEFLLTAKQGQEVIDHVIGTIRRSWSDVCDEAELSTLERSQLWGREILNPYSFYDSP